MRKTIAIGICGLSLVILYSIKRLWITFVLQEVPEEVRLQKLENETSSSSMFDGSVSTSNHTGSSNNHTGNAEDSPFMELPNILLLGCQKCGSSAFAEWLFDQGVYGGETFGEEPFWYKKEVKFYNEEARWAQGIEFYSKRFKHAYGKDHRNKLKANTNYQGPLVMDATPNTQFFPDRVHQIYKDYPEQHSNLKMMIVTRDPVYRALSWYNYKKNYVLQEKKCDSWWASVCHEDGTFKNFSEYIDVVEPPNFGTYYDAGMYAMYHEKWLQYFRPDQILVLSYEEYKTNTAKLQWRVKQFLNAPHFKEDGVMKKANTRAGSYKVKYMSCKTREKLQEFYEPENTKFYNFTESGKAPWMQEQPFPRFQPPECTEEVE